MTVFQTKLRHLFSGRNITIWLIIAAMSLAVSSCGTPRSVRGGRYIEPVHSSVRSGNDSKETEQVSDNTRPVSTHTLSRMLDSISHSYGETAVTTEPAKPLDMQAEYAEEETTDEIVEAEEIPATESQPLAMLGSEEAEKQAKIIQPVEAGGKTEAAATSSKLPSLQQQLRNLQQNQQEMRQDVDNLKDDVKDIKTTLDKIKQHLDDKDNSPEPVKGPPAKPANSSKPNVIQPKEARTETIATLASERSAEPEINNNNPVEANDSESQDELKTEYETALELLQNKQYNKAIRQLQRVVSNIKDSDKRNSCNYWLGKSHYHLEQYQKAIAYFYYVLRSDSQNMKDDAQIMIAESHIRSGQVPEAKRAYKSLLQDYPQSRLVPKARKMLQQL